MQTGARSYCTEPLAVRWLSHLSSRNYSSGTLRAYSHDLKLWFAYLAHKGVTLDQVDVDFIEEWMRRLREQEIATKTVKRRVSALREFYRFLKVKKLVPDNPFNDLGRIKGEKRLPAFFQEPEVERLIESSNWGRKKMHGPRNRALLELLYSTGCRVSEAAGVDVDWILWESNLVKLYGKGRKERLQPIGRVALRAIRAYLPFREEQLAAKGRHYERALFVSERGTRMSVDAIQDVVATRGKAAGLAKAHPQMLRHSFATHVHERGADLSDVQQLLDHENIQTTTIYRHTARKRLQRVFRKNHPRA